MKTLFLIRLIIITLVLSTSVHSSTNGLEVLKIKTLSIDHVSGFEFKNMKVVVEKNSTTWMLLHDAFDSTKYLITKCKTEHVTHECVNIFNTKYDSIQKQKKNTLE